MNIDLGAYSSFKIVLEKLPTKGMIFYTPDASGVGWSIVFVARDLSTAMSVAGAFGSFPSTFATDFPAAIYLPDETATQLKTQTGSLGFRAA